MLYEANPLMVGVGLLGSLAGIQGFQGYGFLLSTNRFQIII